MTLQRLSLGRGKRLDQPTDSTGHREFAGGGALAFVRHGAASWKSFYRLERATLEGALALAGAGQGQALLVTTHGPRSFADRRLDLLEVKTIGPGRPFGLARDLVRAALARPDAKVAAASLPGDLLTNLKTTPQALPADANAWVEPIADFIAALPSRGPSCIVLDHVHHADADSLRVIDALLRRVGGKRILLIVTYRMDAPLHPQLESMRREWIEARLVRAMTATSLPADEARMMFQSAFGRSARPENVASALAGDLAGLVVHGLVAVEACRRAGRWSEARALAERVGEAGDSHRAPYVAYSAAIALGHLLADYGKWDDSAQRLERVQPGVEATKEDDLIAWLYWGLARAYWGRSERRRGFQMLRLAQTVSTHIADGALAASVRLCGVEWLADNRRVSASADWLADLERQTDPFNSVAAGAMLAQAAGTVALAEGDPIAATGHFRSALRQWSVMEDDFSGARARLRLASALLARDDPDSRRDGREELSDAHAEFSRLGAAHEVSVTEALGAQYGIRPRARRAASGGSASPGGITPREREVLQLIVRGMTNRQIAATLSITEKTAEGHVSNILAKLGVASRGQAAGYALANGLLETAEAA